MRVFDQAERQGRKFIEQTGLHCPLKCGECCHSKNIYATVLECLPISIKLWKEGKGDQVYDFVSRNSESSLCVFFKDQLSHEDVGHCSIYHYRFLVCRLFSNSVRFDAHGKIQLQTCKLIKQQQEDRFHAAQKQLENGIKAPISSNFAFRLYSIDPYLGKDLLPVNVAIKKALEITYIHSHIFHKAS